MRPRNRGVAHGHARVGRRPVSPNGGPGGRRHGNPPPRSLAPLASRVTTEASRHRRWGGAGRSQSQASCQYCGATAPRVGPGMGPASRLRVPSWLGKSNKHQSEPDFPCVNPDLASVQTTSNPQSKIDDVRGQTLPCEAKRVGVPFDRNVV